MVGPPSGSKARRRLFLYAGLDAFNSGRRKNMTSFARDWPVYFVIGGLVIFMVYVFIHSNRKGGQDKNISK